MNLSFILKALGIKLTPDQIAGIEAVIPQIPGKIQQTISIVNDALKLFDSRLKEIEENQRLQMTFLMRIVEALNERNDSDDGVTKPAGIGATQRLLERTGGNISGSGNGS